MADPFDVTNSDAVGSDGGNPDFWRNLMAFGAATSQAANARDSQGFLVNGPGVWGPVGAGVTSAMSQSRQNMKDRAAIQSENADIQTKQMGNINSLQHINMLRLGMGMQPLQMRGIPDMTPPGMGGQAQQPQLADGGAGTGMPSSPSAGMSVPNSSNNQPASQSQGGQQGAQNNWTGGYNVNRLFAVAQGAATNDPQEAGYAAKFADPERAKALTEYSMAAPIASSKPTALSENSALVQNGNVVATGPRPAVSDGTVRDANGNVLPEGTPYTIPAKTGTGSSGTSQQGAGTFPSASPAAVNAIAQTLKFEGGMAPSDGASGAPALYGINAKYHPAEFQQAQQITAAQGPAAGQAYAANFYKKNYWDANNLDSLDPKVAQVTFDGLVNHRPAFGQSLVDAAQSGATPQVLLTMRAKEYQRLAAADPQKYGQSLPGWLGRLDELDKSVGGGKGPTPGSAPDQGAGASGSWDDSAKNKIAPVTQSSSNGNPGVVQTGISPQRKALQEKTGADIAEGKKAVAQINSRIQSAREILKKMGELNTDVPYGVLSDVKLGVSNNFGGKQKAAYDTFNTLNNNLFTQELPAIVQASGGRIDIPLVQAIQKASSVDLNSNPRARRAVIGQLDSLLTKVQNNATRYEAGLTGKTQEASPSAPPGVTHIWDANAKKIVPITNFGSPISNSGD